MGASVSGGRRKTGRNEFLLARRLDNNTICRRISDNINTRVQHLGYAGWDTASVVDVTGSGLVHRHSHLLLGDRVSYAYVRNNICMSTRTTHPLKASFSKDTESWMVVHR